MSKSFDVSAENMWARAGGWDSIHRWHPAIAPTEVLADGDRRRLTLRDGGQIAETLLDLGECYYTYRFDESPFPVDSCISTIQVHSEGRGCVVHWEKNFELNGDDEALALGLIISICRDGLRAL